MPIRVRPQIIVNNNAETMADAELAQQQASLPRETAVAA